MNLRTLFLIQNRLKFKCSKAHSFRCLRLRLHESLCSVRCGYFSIAQYACHPNETAHFSDDKNHFTTLRTYWFIASICWTKFHSFNSSNCDLVWIVNLLVDGEERHIRQEIGIGCIQFNIIHEHFSGLIRVQFTVYFSMIRNCIFRRKKGEKWQSEILDERVRVCVCWCVRNRKTKNNKKRWSNCNQAPWKSLHIAARWEQTESRHVMNILK